MQFSSIDFTVINFQIHSVTTIVVSRTDQNVFYFIYLNDYWFQSEIDATLVFYILDCEIKYNMYIISKIDL